MKSFSHHSSNINLNYPIQQTLGISSEYDFEKGILINKKIKIPNNSTFQLPQLQRHKSQQLTIKFPQKIKEIQCKKRMRLTPAITTQIQPPPLGYYNVNESSFQSKCQVNMSKQQPTSRMNIIRNKSKSIDTQILQNKEIENINQLSEEKLNQWISKEMNILKQCNKFDRTLYKGNMHDEQKKNENFQKLFEKASLRLKFIKYYF